MRRRCEAINQVDKFPRHVHSLPLSQSIAESSIIYVHCHCPPPVSFVPATRFPSRDNYFHSLFFSDEHILHTANPPADIYIFQTVEFHPTKIDSVSVNFVVGDGRINIVILNILYVRSYKYCSIHYNI